MARAYSYIRCSSPEQMKGDTLRRQLSESQEWCTANGHVLDDTLRDLGKSAFKGDHAKFGELSAFLQLVNEGKIERGSILVVESLDRLSREAVLVALARLLDIINAGIIVFTLTDKKEYGEASLLADPTPLLTSIIIMMRSHEESKLKAYRVGKAWGEKRALAATTGQAMTSICPGWIRLVGGPKTGRYELIEERAAVVRSIFEDTISGLGRRAIVKRLNGLRLPTWGLGKKAGMHWHDSYIQKVLENPATYGRYEPLSKRSGGDGTAAVTPIDGYFPPVIDETMFYSARAAAKSRGKGGGRTSVGHRNLLRKLAKCATCEGNLTIVDKGKRSSGPKLICSRANINAGCTDRTYYPYQMVETLTLAAVSDRLDALVLSSKDQSATVRVQRDGEVAKRADKQSRLDNLIELAAATGRVSSVAVQVKALQRDVDALDREIARLDALVVETNAGSGADAAASFLELQRQLRDTQGDEHARVRAAVAQRLRGLVDRIVVGHGEATIHLKGGGTGYFAGF